MENNKFKNKKQPELTENRTVWNSDNQGVKEETFIQNGRRGGDRQLDREDLQQDTGLQTGRSHICVRISLEVQLGSKTDHATQASSSGK